MVECHRLPNWIKKICLVHPDVLLFWIWLFLTGRGWAAKSQQYSMNTFWVQDSQKLLRAKFLWLKITLKYSFEKKKQQQKNTLFPREHKACVWQEGTVSYFSIFPTSLCCGSSLTFWRLLRRAKLARNFNSLLLDIFFSHENLQLFVHTWRKLFLPHYHFLLYLICFKCFQQFQIFTPT